MCFPSKHYSAWRLRILKENVVAPLVVTQQTNVRVACVFGCGWPRGKGEFFFRSKQLLPTNWSVVGGVVQSVADFPFRMLNCF